MYRKGLGYLKINMDQKGLGNTDQKGLGPLKLNTDLKGLGSLTGRWLSAVAHYHSGEEEEVWTGPHFAVQVMYNGAGFARISSIFLTQDAFFPI